MSGGAGRAARALAGLLLALTSVIAGHPAVPHPPRDAAAAPPPSLIPDQYIVRLQPAANPDKVAAGLGVKPIYTYSKIMKGFTALMTAGQLGGLRRHPDVAEIEQDGRIRHLDLHPVIPLPPPLVPALSWANDRINQRSLPLDGSFHTHHDGAGVTAYIVDSGIDTAQPAFTGRLDPGYSSIRDGRGTGDCAGQGTLVAGIVAGTSWGVAPKARLAPVRVLDCAGNGTFGGMIAGFDWIAGHLRRPAVVNVSVSGLRSAVANDAAKTLSDLGAFVVASGGDQSGDACTASPGSASGVVTVAASSIEDAPAPGGNAGPCVDLYAPGVGIVSAAAGGGEARGSGSGYAAPYVTATAALLKQAYGDSSTVTVRNWLVGHATSALRDVPAGTPDRLLYIDDL
ncbi:serine protease [Sphaerisporangium rufum]|uniref:Serine protease n=1 Tax=Sphaerisporangium rufum TaxID=1381558 RepID=A0A919R5E4_9ACTN|nr:S8 family peptidase [Sphaerisporangium rufum]GII79448.1 serine protease [Sphaerisporangium rufum]